MTSFFKHSILLLVFNIFFIQPSYSQSYEYEGFAENAAYGTNGSLITFFTGKVSYERLLINPENFLNASLWLKADVGIIYISELFSYAGVGFTLLTNGKKNNHTELNASVSYFNEIIGNDNDHVLPNFSIGYRYQKPEGGLIFRTGLGVPEWVYISFGYAF